MTEEEKRAKDIIKGFIKNNSCKRCGNCVVKESNIIALKTLINLTEKQQKEIEEYKNKYEDLYNAKEELFVDKDKIREKIKELEITRNSCVTDNGFTIMSVVISNFKELLEEN